MTTTRRAPWRLLSAALLMAVVGACSLVNSFPDVVPATTVDGAPPSTDAPDVDAETDSSVGHDSAPDGNPPADAGPDADSATPSEAGDAADAATDVTNAADATDATDGATSLDADATTDADAADAPVPDANRGAIVVGGTIESADAGAPEYVVTALDPTTGAELERARQPMLVSAVFYDGSRDLWYVFESGGANFYPLPGDPFYLHMRTLDPVTGTWVDLSKTTIPPGVSFLTTGVMGESVSYVAYGDDADAGGPVADAGVSIPAAFGLVTLDTSNPQSVTVSSVVPLSTAPASVLGTSSTVNAFGGYATMGTTLPTGFAQLAPVLIPAAGPPEVLAAIPGTAKTGSLVGYGTGTVNATQELFVVTRPFSAAVATLQVFDPTEGPGMELLGSGQFAFGDANVRSPAFSTCLGMLFVVGANADLNVYGVSVAGVQSPGPDGGVPTLLSGSAPLHHSGQGVYFEPYTSTVLAPFSQGANFTLSAFSAAYRADGFTPVLSPLGQAQGWSPPPQLSVNFVATRSPSSFVCP